MIYNIFSVITLAPILYYAYIIRGLVIFSWYGYLAIIQWMLILIGAILLIGGSIGYSFSQFSGIKQIKTECVEENDVSSDKLNTSGISGIIRHPWYTAVILLLWSRELNYSALTVNIVFTIYLILGAHLEELKLAKAFGDQYRNYKKNVSMFVPIKWIYKHVLLKNQ
jgi:protein-S-isoprenylcysteine O-methyltransferase Ste14